MGLDRRGLARDFACVMLTIVVRLDVVGGCEGSDCFPVAALRPACVDILVEVFVEACASVGIEVLIEVVLCEETWAGFD